MSERQRCRHCDSTRLKLVDCTLERRMCELRDAERAHFERRQCQNCLTITWFEAPATVCYHATKQPTTL